MNLAEVLFAVVLVCFVLGVSDAEQTEASDLQNASRNLARRKRFFFINHHNKCNKHQGTVNNLRKQLCAAKKAKAKAEADCRNRKTDIRAKLNAATRDCVIKMQRVNATNKESLNKLRRQTEELFHNKAQLQKMNSQLQSEHDDVTDELNQVRSRLRDMKRDLKHGKKIDNDLQKTIDALREKAADSGAGDTSAGFGSQGQVGELQRNLARLKEQAKTVLAELVQLRKQDWSSTQTLIRLQTETDSYRKAAVGDKTQQLQECEHPPVYKRPSAPLSVGPLKALYTDLMKRLESMEAQVAQHEIIGCSSIVIVTKEAKPDQCANAQAALNLCEEQRVAHRAEAAAAEKDTENCEKQMLYLRQRVQETHEKLEAPLQTLRTRLTLIRTNADKCQNVLGDVKDKLGHAVEASLQLEMFSAES